MPESDALLARSLGRRLRLARLSQRKQQTVVAGLAGITTDYLYQIERGLKLPSLTVLMELARVLDMPLSALLGETDDDRSGRVTTATRTPSTGIMGPSAFFDALPAPGSVPVAERLYAAMTAPGSDRGQDAGPELHTEVERAWRLWQHSPQRYSQVGELVPTLVVEVEHQLRQLQHGETTDQRRAVARHASDLYGLLRSFCKRVSRIELSLLSAERAIRTAELADDRTRLAAARWNLAHVLLADGQIDGAEDVAMTAAEALRPSLSGSSENTDFADLAALYGALLLVGSMAAVRRGDAWTARRRVTDAERLAAKTGELNVCWTVFGPTNVAMHAATIELMAGQAAEGLHIGERIDHRAAASIERRISFLLDQAQGWRQRRDNAQVMLLLLEAEREAPEDMRFRPAGRDLIQHLVKHGRRSVAERAAQMATRLGLPL